MDSTSVPHFDFIVNENEIEKGALRVLEIIRPHWDKNDIQFKLLTDGITNKLVRCKHQNVEESEIVLVRVYGNKTDLLIDRKAETRNILLLNKVGLAPELYATFENGLAYKFVPGVTIQPETVSDPIIFKLIAKKMANMHRVQVTDQTHIKPCLWEKMLSFWNLIPDKFTNEQTNKRIADMNISKSRISEEMFIIKNILESTDSLIVFAHNDLLLGNVIYTKEKNTITFIDYEYAALNYQAYDIANHFCEFVGLEVVDYSKYPSKELQLKWLSTYLMEFNQREPSKCEIQKLYKQVNKFALASHLFWGIWSLIQAEHSYIDFDFVEYSGLRFQEYFKKKEEFLCL